MATPITAEKPRLVTAYAGFLADPRYGKTPAQNDPALAAYLARIEKNCKSLGERMSEDTYNRLNNYAVAKADGLWLLFNPKTETLQKEYPSSRSPVGKFIAVDIPKGMWSIGGGKMMVGIASGSCLHADILTDLMYIVVSEKNTIPKEMFGGMGGRFFSFGKGMTVDIIGGGAIEYKYRPDGQMLTIFVDPVLSSRDFSPVPPNVLSEIMERVNGCEGVRIEHRCL